MNCSSLQRLLLLLALPGLAGASRPLQAAGGADPGPSGAHRPVRIVLVGDSTVSETDGWGPGFRQFLDPQVQCLNLAANGRSSMSFVREGRWKNALDLKPDYILIQFGHNDQPGKPGRSTTLEEFRENMARYVDEARAAGAKPILVTSLVRREFDPSDPHRIHSSLEPWAAAVRQIAAKKQVPLIDLHARSLDLCERMGMEACLGFSPMKDPTTYDHTHLNAKGSALFGELVAAELRKAEPALAPYLRDPAGSDRPPALPVIAERTFHLADYGARGDGSTLNTEAFRRAISAVDRAGGGRLVVPRGVFVTGPFELCSGLDLHLEAGAVIQAPSTFQALSIPDPSSFRSQKEVNASVKAPPPLISGHHLHDVALTGEGTIDGSGRHWWDHSERAARGHPGILVYPRPNLVSIDHCERLRVADLTFANSSKFHLVPSYITDLTIERVKIRAPFDAPNTDGIDPGPVTNALIRGCDVDTGDDDIVIKSGGTHIVIEDCSIRHGHGISIGSETVVGVHGMIVRRCTFNGSDNGIRIKSMRGAGGSVSDVRYTDITMHDVANAILLDLNYVDNNRPDFKGDPTRIPSIRDVLIDHVTIEGSKNAGRIVGLPDSPILRVTLRDVRIVAETDLVIKDAEPPSLERVSRSIRAGVAGQHPKIVE